MNIPKHLSLVPVELEQRAVSIAFAEVIRKNKHGKKLAELPYATEFCRAYFNTPRPSKRQLSGIVEYSGTSIPEILKRLDLFLRSNGSRRYLLSRSFTQKAFPCLHTQEITRSDNRVNLEICQSNNISDKLTTYKTETKSQKIAEITKLGNKELGRWVRENEGVLSEYDLVDGLREWFKSNNSDPFEFNYLYQDMTASRIAYDLSFDE